jgi:molybdopterin converting factor subunit 1
MGPDASGPSCFRGIATRGSAAPVMDARGAGAPGLPRYPPRVRIRVLLFAGLRESAGTGEVSLEVPEGSRAAAARSALEARFPKLPKGFPAALAVNGSYVHAEGPLLHEGDEVALLPPVSGG